jgi:hypothetical protein
MNPEPEYNSTEDNPFNGKGININNLPRPPLPPDKMEFDTLEQANEYQKRWEKFQQSGLFRGAAPTTERFDGLAAAARKAMEGPPMPEEDEAPPMLAPNKAPEDRLMGQPPQEDYAKTLYDASVSMLQKLQEVTSHKDFKTCMAVSEMQGFKYTGPWIIEEAKALALAVQAYQGSLASPPEQLSSR